MYFSEKTGDHRDWEIQTILKLLEETREKLKLSLILPKILENPRVFAYFMKGTKYEEAIKLVKNFRISRVSNLNQINNQ